MTRYSFRTAVVAAALFGTGWYAMAQGDNANAQDAPAAIATSAPQAEPTPDVRFVAEPVVQALPEPEAAPEEPEFQPQGATSLAALMDTVPHDGAMNADMQCLAKAVYFEARGEPIDGQLAVARVIVNRANDRRFPDTYCGVVTQRSQFSFVKNGHIPEPRAGQAWNRARKIARIAHQELWHSEAGDSLYFHANYVQPGWSRRMTRVARIDTHTFYR